MTLILDLRDNSKKNKDWETADIIRDKLSEINIQIKDTKDGSQWSGVWNHASLCGRFQHTS